MRRAVGIGVAAWVLGVGSPVAADTGLDECFRNYEQAQRLRAAGRLRAAEVEAVRCAQETCPEEISADCSIWRSELRALVPSLLVRAKWKKGCNEAPLRVRVDGELRAEFGRGLEIPVDPGTHVVRLEGEGGLIEEREVDVTQGHLGRPVDFQVGGPGSQCPRWLPDAASALGRSGPSSDVADSVSPLAYVLGGVGAALVVSGASLWVSGEAQRSDLGDCRPRCAPGDVDTMKRTYLLGDIAWAGGLVTLGIAGYIWMARSSSPAPAVSGGAVALPWHVAF